jgi:hypothetical protein
MPLQFVADHEKKGLTWLKGVTLDAVTPAELRNVYLSVDPPHSQRDEFSYMDEGDLAQKAGRDAHKLCLSAFPANLTRRKSALRWIARGVRPAIAICKVFCDLEASAKQGTNHDTIQRPKKPRKARA